ncbi:MAG: hypothetical protein DBY35_00600 [Bacteroidales bacterium]|nr:MAG: hypothetical protein DBY35_00600 [Bacteroidales bacterium]
MIKKFLMTTIVSLIVLNSYSEEIVIYKKGSTELPKDVCEKPIDIHVDEPEKELSLVFNKSIEVRTIISGPKGIIFNDDIDGKRNTTININLKGSGEGDYDVLLIDNSGNVTDSSFYIPETNY